MGPKLTEMAEECAKRLVGQNGVVTWSEVFTGTRLQSESLDR
jgi:hypothetical protein